MAECYVSVVKKTLPHVLQMCPPVKYNMRGKKDKDESNGKIARKAESVFISFGRTGMIQYLKTVIVEASLGVKKVCIIH